VLLAIALNRVVRARRNPVEVGIGNLVRLGGRVRRDGFVQVAGELWRARSSGGAQLVPGDHVTVEAVEDDLRLVVGSTHRNGRT